MLKIIKIYIDFFEKASIINTGIKEKVDILKFDKETVLKILELSKQFDKNSYSTNIYWINVSNIFCRFIQR